MRIEACITPEGTSNAQHMTMASQFCPFYTANYYSVEHSASQLQLIKFTQCQNTTVELQADIQSADFALCLKFVYHFSVMSVKQKPANIHSQITVEQ